uniref:Integrin inhibitor n=1 Tax=synthetic construct TaxID=32630 RepID=UPI00211DA425|nr:Chain A, Integrin inhibitor [synthetic construct]7LMV_B Chain B, Integrin inhibitor [synthetic construct]7LMV_C Chain C, Integrin inhibitor [synthetic construct]7LMV_D Chain D, Integrin inhibitor [synthetic construct]7LMV_E Chain E, Integrin inhibitor [synthetic construct]7LMV_F Chain F, Integrin inhibitor [synthetic construct]7LMV_G Chain G, Integrin inhibitor [synthetic construct]7LMV_H Chain H, Integrin inhibitor [synthetic construct]7LMV_I Chain I, Integrin inhibitor [synthetic const
AVVRFVFRGDLAELMLRAVKDHLKKEGPHWNITSRGNELVVRGIHESDAKRIQKEFPSVQSTIQAAAAAA